MLSLLVLNLNLLIELKEYLIGWFFFEIASLEKYRILEDDIIS